MPPPPLSTVKNRNFCALVARRPPLGEEDLQSLAKPGMLRALIIWRLLLLVLCLASPVLAGESDRLYSDRAAVEQVYYNHRLGTKPPFAEALPPGTLRKLLELDARKEAVLQRVYGLTVTPAMLEAEVRRIDATSRAPEVLAELKAALDHDPARFAATIARPIVVERELHQRFVNDDALHAAERRQAEQTRAELLAARSEGYLRQLALLQQGRTNQVAETTWQLAARPAETNAPAADLAEIHRRFGPDAQLLTPASGGEKDRRFYFADLPTELQTVLRAQLRQAGDVSAVIETPAGFLLYVVREKTEANLSVAGLQLPKRSYEEWLESAGH